MKNLKTILLTGFGSFSDTDNNPTIKVVEHLLKSNKSWRSNNSVHGSIVNIVAYSECEKNLEQNMKKHNPDIVISFGLKAFLDNEIVLEANAFNGEEDYGLDVLNEKPKARRPFPKAPDTLQPNFNIEKIIKNLKSETTPNISISDYTAYVCNHYYFNALNYIRENDQNKRAIFIHIPPETETCTIEKINNACEKIVIELLENAN